MLNSNLINLWKKRLWLRGLGKQGNCSQAIEAAVFPRYITGFQRYRKREIVSLKAESRPHSAFYTICILRGYVILIFRKGENAKLWIVDCRSEWADIKNLLRFSQFFFHRWPALVCGIDIWYQIGEQVILHWLRMLMKFPQAI